MVPIILRKVFNDQADVWVEPVLVGWSVASRAEQYYNGPHQPAFAEKPESGIQVNSLYYPDGADRAHCIPVIETLDQIHALAVAELKALRL